MARYLYHNSQPYAVPPVLADTPETEDRFESVEDIDVVESFLVGPGGWFEGLRGGKGGLLPVDWVD